jgi:DNA sulfur modification protein DndB
MPAKYFPGIRAKMGRWDYFIVQMSMRDLNMIEFAHQFNEFGGSLSEALQRELNASRATKQILRYLVNQPDRFFNALVIAGFGGEPEWFPIQIEDRPEYRLIADGELLETFGVLKMGSKTRYFALDGQHRLLAIKELLNPAGEFVGKAPSGFDQETMAVCLVVPNQAEGINQFRERFRRLFGHLNRYAKPMDAATNVIMDEDDAVAICLRRLFSDHEFFKTIGPDKDSARIITTSASKNVPAGAIQLTSIVTLYDLCGNFLESARRINALARNGVKFDEFKRFRPDDPTLDEMYGELVAIWDGVLAVFPELERSGVEMRDNNVTDLSDSAHQNHLLFRPIGQIAFSKVVRTLLNGLELETTTKSDVIRAIDPLRGLNMDLGKAPWRHLVWVNHESEAVEGESSWKITEKPRKKVESFINALMLAYANKLDLDPLAPTFRELVTLPFNEKTSIENLWKELKKSFDQ